MDWTKPISQLTSNEWLITIGVICIIIFPLVMAVWKDLKKLEQDVEESKRNTKNRSTKW